MSASDMTNDEIRRMVDLVEAGQRSLAETGRMLPEQFFARVKLRQARCARVMRYVEPFVKANPDKNLHDDFAVLRVAVEQAALLDLELFRRDGGRMMAATVQIDPAAYDAVVQKLKGDRDELPPQQAIVDRLGYDVETVRQHERSRGIQRKRGRRRK